MAPVLDETARDLPVRDVGLMRGGLMPAATAESDVKPWKKHQTMRIKADPQRLFRFPREHLEDLCLRLQEENNVLRQHTRTQEHRLRRMSNRLVRLRQAQSGSGAAKERDMEDTLQELEARVVTLESQKGVLQNKLSLARQHILDLGGRSTHKHRGKSMEVEGGVRRAAQTAPARYGPTLEDTRVEIERFRSSVAEQMRAAEMELTAQALRDTLRDKEREIEGTMREMKKQQADRHRISIRENVDLIRLQKQLSDKSTALRVTQERFNDLQEVYEKQLEESQKSLKESHETLLGKVELLSEQLKQERQRALTVEGELTSATLTLQSLDKLHERISDLEGERDLIKESYDSLLESTLTTQSSNKDEAEGSVEPRQNAEEAEESALGSEVTLLQGMLRIEREERSRLEQERERLRGDKEILEEQRQRDRELSVMMRESQERLEQEVSQYKEQISALQERLDSVSKEFDMSVEELSETLVQIKAFRMQQESREGLSFLRLDGNADDPAVNTQALHAETALELQKTRKLLLVEHRISKERQEELNAVTQRIAREREEVRTRMAEKDKLLLKRAQQINTLQAQLKEFTNSSGEYRRSIPVQYTWPAGDQEVVPPLEEDVPFSQLRAGESLLEIHIKAATFTPGGLRRLGSLQAGEDGADNVVTFCTYGLLDFEVHSTPVVSGSQPNYGFTSRYALTPRDLGRLGGQGSGVRVELHQALGGVRFMTHGSGLMSLLGAMDRRGERITGLVNITGAEGEIVGAVDFWVRLFPPAERVEIAEKPSDRRTVTQRCPVPVSLGWQDTSQEEIHDYGGGIPNELVLVLERCVGLSARWPGLLPDPYLTCRFYDLPPHVSHTVQCSADPVFNDTASYPLAVTSDVMNYLRSSSLWVYVYDDSDDQMPPAYLAKTPIPLQALASGRDIRGDYVLRDPAGGPRGMVRVMLKWKYPFQPPVETLPRRAERGGDRRGAALMDSSEREERSGGDTEPPQRPIAKPRAKLFEQGDVKAVQRDTKAWPQPPSDKQRRSQTVKTQQVSSGKAPSVRQATDRKRSARRSPDRWGERPPGRAESKLSAKPHLLTTKLSGEESSRQSLASLSRKSSASDTRTQDLPSLDQVSMDEEEEVEEEESESAAAEHSEAQESSVSSSSQSDIIVIPRKRKTKRGNKLRVEILSLTFEPSSHVALDKSVQRVYVEYRLLGVPMETTETPMSLRKPRRGEEIHYNFTRVLYVDGSQSAPLRQYLYTMLEGSDPNQGRLKFTVVSEPMDDDEECVDVGHAFLDLQELLLTGNDVFERQIDIVSVDEDKEVIGNLKVSLEAAKALSGIYREFHQEADTKTEDESDEEEEEEDEEEEEEEEEKEEEEHKEQRSKKQIHEIEYDNDSDDF